MPLTRYLAPLLFGLIGAGILVGLGIWQLQRLDWKESVLAQIESRIAADPEPLPAGHPFWSHPRILLTPHNASMTSPDTAVDFVLDVIARHGRGEELPGLVDRRRGY